MSDDDKIILCFLGFLIVVATFLLVRTSVGTELRAWLSRKRIQEKYGNDRKYLDHLLQDANRIAGEALDNQTEISRIVGRLPPDHTSQIHRALDMLEAAHSHLLRTAAEADMGERSILVQEREKGPLAPVVPIAAPFDWVDGKPRPRPGRMR